MENETINRNISDVKGSYAEMNGIKFNHVDGQQKGFVQLFALSTCDMCEKTRMFLEKNNIAYDYIYVDQLSGKEKDKVIARLEKFNAHKSFPTLVVNSNGVIIGYEPEEMKVALSIHD